MFDWGFDKIGVAGVTAFIDSLAWVDREIDDAARVDLLRVLEEAKAACAAAQAKTAADLDRSRRAEREGAGVPVAHQGRGIASEVALARRESPHRGDRHLGFAKALVHDMPNTLKLLEQGLMSEWRATLLVQGTICLTRDDRMAIDAELCADPSTLDGVGDRGVAAMVREKAAARDAQALVRQAQKAVSERRVSTRPAPDNMAYLTALLPMKDAVTIQATLGRDADTLVGTGESGGRTRAQVMADLLVERTTGVDTAAGPPVAVNLVISDHTLFAAGTEAAHVDGYGPVPAVLARLWVKESVESPDILVELRRLYANPATGALVAMESTSRCFRDGLGFFVDTRDRICRTPWCDAPIRHGDHLVDYADGGPTSAVNAAGLCEACNHAKQGRGWRAKPDPEEPGQLHSYHLTTPSGHTYQSTAPPMPKPLEIDAAA